MVFMVNERFVILNVLFRITSLLLTQQSRFGCREARWSRIFWRYKANKKAKKRRYKACRGSSTVSSSDPCASLWDKCDICNGTGKVTGNEDAAFDPANFSEEQKERIRKAAKMLGFPEEQKLFLKLTHQQLIIFLDFDKEISFNLTNLIISATDHNRILRIKDYKGLLFFVWISDVSRFLFELNSASPSSSPYLYR